MTENDHAHEKRVAQIEKDQATLAAAIKKLAEATGIVWGDIAPTGWKW